MSVLKNQTPVISGDSTEEWIEFVLKPGSVLVIQGKSLEEIAEKSKQAQSLGLYNIILYPDVKNVKEALLTFSQSRKMALENNINHLKFLLGI